MSMATATAAPRESWFRRMARAWYLFQPRRDSHLISQAKDELRRINFGAQDSAVMIELLEKFLDQWDSGGAVWAAAPVFQRLLAGKCLSPLTGEPDEWFDHGEGLLQNKRISSVFKDPRFHEGKLAYDLDNPLGPRVAIEFPYYPKGSEISEPTMMVECS